MRGDLATKWWTPVSLRGVVSFAWISLLITAFMVGISSVSYTHLTLPTICSV